MARTGRFPAFSGSRRGWFVAPAVIGALALAAAAPAAAAAPVAAKATSPRVIATVKTGANPGEVAVSPRTGEAYVINRGSNTVTVISGRTNKVAATIPIRQSNSNLAPTFIAVDPVTGDIYVTNQNINGNPETGTVTVISGRSNKVITTIGVGINPGQAVISPVNGEVYVPSGNAAGGGSVTVISGRSHKVITSVPVGGNFGGDEPQLAVGPRTGLVYVLDDSNYSVTVISGKTNKVVGTVSVADPALSGDQWEPSEIAVSPVTGEVYVVTVAYHSPGLVTVISGKTNTVIARILPPGYGTGEIAISPKTGAVYVAWDISATVSVISGKTNTVTADISFPDGNMSTEQVAVSPVTGNVYANGQTNALGAVWEISGKTNEIIGHASTNGAASIPGDPISPITGDVYSINGLPGDVISVISG